MERVGLIAYTRRIDPHIISSMTNAWYESPLAWRDHVLFTRPIGMYTTLSREAVVLSVKSIVENLWSEAARTG